MVRIGAGKYGEHEQRSFADSVCYLTSEGTEDRDLHQARDYEGIGALLAEPYADEKPKTHINWTSQVAPFVFYMRLGDWVVMPHKRKPAIAFSEVSKGYEALTPVTPRRATAPHWRRMSGSGCGRDALRAR